MVNILTVEIGEDTFDTFKSVEIDTSLDTFGSAFNIAINVPIEKKTTLTSAITSLLQDDKPDFNLQGSLVRIKIDRETLLTGFIEKQTITYSKNNSIINVQGRDKLCDFADSRFSNKMFKPPISFIDVLEKLLKECGYIVVDNKTSPLVSGIALLGLGNKLLGNQVKIINEYEETDILNFYFGKTIEKFQTNESIGFNKDESAYNLIQRLADKRRLVLGTDGDGNIVIRAIGQETADTVLVNDTFANKPNQNNNIISANIVRDDSRRYYEYKIFSSGTNTSTSTSIAGTLTDNLKNNTTQYSGVFYDNEIRKTRKFLDNVSGMGNELCKQRAEWECNIRRARAFEYRCTVFGWRQNLKEMGLLNFSANSLWKVNQQVIVKDSRAKLFNEKLLIKSVTYKQDSQGGTTSDLVLVSPLSYTDSVFEPRIRLGRRKNNQGAYIPTPEN